MFEIIGKDPSFNLIVPAECDIGRNTYRIVNNDGRYHSGILTMGDADSGLGLRGRFTPNDPEIQDPIKSLLGYQDSFSEEGLRGIFKEILKMNDQVRKGLENVFAGEHIGVLDTNGPYWWHAFRLPKTDLMDGNTEFDELEGESLKKSFIHVYQEPRATMLKIMEPSYNRLYAKTKAKIKKALALLSQEEVSGDIRLD